MRLSVRRIRAINRVLASINGRPFYNEDKPVYPAKPDQTWTKIVYVPPSQMS